MQLGVFATPALDDNTHRYLARALERLPLQGLSLFARLAPGPSAVMKISAAGPSRRAAWSNDIPTGQRAQQGGT
jgi:hypothetical protein